MDRISRKGEAMEKGKYSALVVAKWLIAWAHSENAPLSNMKLQKLLYYAQGHYLAKHDNPLFADRMEAWSHGPVVPTVYRKFKDAGSDDIDLPDPKSFRWSSVDDETADLLMDVWGTYGIYAAWRLREMSHDERPWKEAFRPDESYIEITPAAIQRGFRAIV